MLPQYFVKRISQIRDGIDQRAVEVEDQQKMCHPGEDASPPSYSAIICVLAVRGEHATLGRMIAFRSPWAFGRAVS